MKKEHKYSKLKNMKNKIVFLTTAIFIAIVVFSQKGYLKLDLNKSIEVGDHSEYIEIKEPKKKSYSFSNIDEDTLISLNDKQEEEKNNRTLIISQNNSSQTLIPIECDNSIKKLSLTEVHSLKEISPEVLDHFSDKCLESLRHSIPSNLEIESRDCGLFSNKKSLKGCQAYLKAIKSSYITNETRNTSPADMNYIELAANVVNFLSNEDFGSMDRTKKIIDNFYKKNRSQTNVKLAYREYYAILLEDINYSPSPEELRNIEEIESDLSIPSFMTKEGLDYGLDRLDFEGF